MKLETFFEKFDQFADAPGAVAKMRELILESAIRGMLVPHNASDEPASDLLKRIARLQDGQVRKQAALPPVGDDAYVEIPPGWEWTRLGNTGRIFNGDSVSESGKAELAKVEDGLPFVATKDVGYGRAALVYDNGLKVPLRDPRFKVARANAVLICAEGGSAGRKIGVTDRDICFGNKLFANEVWEGIHHRYVFYVYQAPTFFKEFAARMTGIIGGIARSEFLSLPFPLPPLAEQKRIVTKVDELMALCDRLALQQQEQETRHAALARASLARFADAPTPANLNLIFHSSYTIPPADLRKSIFTLAVQGKLVHRIESEGLAADILKQAGVSEEPPEDVPELPTHWIWARLGSIATRMDSGWSPACIPEPAAEGEWGVLKTTAVQTLQYQEVQNKALPPNLEPRPEHEVMDGDILFTRAGPMNRVGILCVARPTRKKLIISDKIIRFHLVVGIDPDFAALSMNAGFSSTVVEGLKSGMAASQVNISQPKLRSVPIPFPPLAEQRRIVAKVEQLMALVDALEQQLAASRATAANLLSALVAELTGTPNDGKVSVPSASTTGRRGRPPKSP